MGKPARLTLLLVGIVGDASACSPSRLERSSIDVFGEFGIVPEQYTFQLTILDTQAGCTVAQTTKVTINDASYPLEYDCSIRRVPAGDDGPITIRAEDAGDDAEMVVSGLFPWRHATFASPANGIATPGSDVVLPVPPEAQNQPGAFLNVTVKAGGDPSLGNQYVQLDGALGAEMHFAAPATVGLYSVWIRWSSLFPASDLNLPVPVTTCRGFKNCVAIAPNLLGPLSLEVRSSP